MASGIELADWFGNEAQRVYASMTERPEDRERRRLAEWVAGKGGTVTERELSRGPRNYREPGAATVALEALVRAGVAYWAEEPPSDRPQGGGHRVRRCVLHGGDTGDGDTWFPFSPTESGDTSQRGETQVSPSPLLEEEEPTLPTLDDERPAPWGDVS